jgi:hypothetical protein
MPSAIFTSHQWRRISRSVCVGGRPVSPSARIGAVHRRLASRGQCPLRCASRAVPGRPQWVARNPARAFAMTFLDRCQGGDYTESQNRDGNLVGEGSGPSQPRVSGQARRSCLGVPTS